MFTCDMSESQMPHVTINGLESSVAEQLLDYAYTAEVRINQKIRSKFFKYSKSLQYHRKKRKSKKKS